MISNNPNPLTKLIETIDTNMIEEFADLHKVFTMVTHEAFLSDRANDANFRQETLHALKKLEDLVKPFAQCNQQEWHNACQHYLQKN